jgi:hypothetical protein
VWQKILGELDDESDPIAHCHEVIARAMQALGIAQRNRWLLANALDHLTLGRVALYQSILLGTASTTAPYIDDAREHIDAAVDGLRKSGAMHRLPLGLVVHAILHHHLRRPDRARADLDDAWFVASRGPMRLQQANIQLARARLFQDRKALTHARVLITECTYNRRLPELEDAERASVRWPAS